MEIRKFVMRALESFFCALLITFGAGVVMASAASAQEDKCIVVFKEDASQDAIDNYVASWEAEGVQVVYRLDLINGIVFAVPSFMSCADLATDPIVISVEKDQRVQSKSVMAAGEGGAGEGGAGEGGAGEGGAGEGGAGEGGAGEGGARSYFEHYFFPIYDVISNYERTWGVLRLYECPYEEDFYTSPYDPKCQSRFLSKALAKLEKRYLKGRPVRVAVFDTGIDAGHPAFGGRVIESIDFVNDCVDFAPARLARLGLLDDCNGHGTHVAGTLGADTVGAATHTEILSIKVLREDTSGELSTLLAGLQWIIKWMKMHGPVDVINMSLAFKEDNILVKRLLDMVLDKGTTVVASVGNHVNWEEDELAVGEGGAGEGGAGEGGAGEGGAGEGGAGEGGARFCNANSVHGAGEGGAGEGGAGEGDVASCGTTVSEYSVMYPAKYSVNSSVIAVTATNPEGKIADFANTGPEVDICAPGVDILSTIPGGLYGVSSGTSMAAPHVSAAVALMRAVNSDLTPALIKSILRETAYGCHLNLDRALRFAHALSLRGRKR